MMVLSDIAAEAHPSADCIFYTLAGHPNDIVLIKRDKVGDWQRAGRVWAELLPTLVDGLRSANKALWNADSRTFVTGTADQLAYTPPPPPPPPPVPLLPPASNAPQHERNWAIWRSHFVDGEKFAPLSKRYDISISRISGIVAKCGREARSCTYWPERVEEDRLLRASVGLEGIEFIFEADDRDYMRMPDGREFYLNGDRKEE